MLARTSGLGLRIAMAGDETVREILSSFDCCPLCVGDGGRADTLRLGRYLVVDWEFVIVLVHDVLCISCKAITMA